MLRSVKKLLSQAPLVRGSCALPSVLLSISFVGALQPLDLTLDLGRQPVAREQVIPLAAKDLL